MTIDATMKGQRRSIMSVACVHGVQDGKIVAEQVHVRLRGRREALTRQPSVRQSLCRAVRGRASVVVGIERDLRRFAPARVYRKSLLYLE
jgi:hypothetical protein